MIMLKPIKFSRPIRGYVTMARNTDTRMPSDEQKAAHVRRTRMANYHASMHLEGFQVSESRSGSSKSTLIRKYKKLALKCV